MYMCVNVYGLGTGILINMKVNEGEKLPQLFCKYKLLLMCLLAVHEAFIHIKTLNLAKHIHCVFMRQAKAFVGVLPLLLPSFTDKHFVLC